MKKLEGRKQVNRIALLFACTYMVSYITRTNFGAIISEMQTATSIPKSLLSMALTGSFITYGAGQVISGIAGDRVSPKKLIAVGLVITTLMNLLIPCCTSPYVMTAVWCVNGFAQSFMWPPMVKILTVLLDDADYKYAISKICWGSSGGTILVYLISPVLISVGNWKWVFVFAAVCGILMLVIWNRSPFDVENTNQIMAVKRNRNKKTVNTGTKKNTEVLWTPVMAGIMTAIILQGMLRDGVATWMPSYISETYQLGNAVSILSGVIMPVFSLLCIQIATRVYVRWFQNPLACAGMCFAAGTVSAFALYLFTGQNAACSVLFSAVLTGCMHGVNLMLICMIPPFFTKYGNTSTISGALNACTYIGSAISTYGIAVLSETAGWHSTILIWGLIGLAGTVLCFMLVHPWKRKYM